MPVTSAQPSRAHPRSGGAILASVAFDLEKLRIERVNAEVHYHATYTFHGLKGVIAERWAHGPIFGAVGEPNPGQLNLTPAAEDSDERLVAVLGLRASALLAEGPKWAPQAQKIATRWFDDVYKALQPQRTVRIVSELFGLYPVRDPYVATRRLISRYYNAEELDAFAGAERFLAAVDIFAADDEPRMTLVMGAVGPPHRGLYFNYANKERDDQWWMGIRLNHILQNEEGIESPTEALGKALDKSYSELSRVVRRAFPAITGD